MLAIHSGDEENNCHVIDVRGLKCPLPVLKTAKGIAALPPGVRVVVLATDPMAAIDIPHFCSERGHRFLGRHDDEGVSRYEIETGG
ncbi:sulfurtransferase TusA family protein [Afifella sp. H1R]|nr:sulfurtransferase TusA family protein [Afifella sp. H1R]MCF1504359.1 sulfurtransferase TusA family protein [Afifella sp. H1R]